MFGQRSVGFVVEPQAFADFGLSAENHVSFFAIQGVGVQRGGVLIAVFGVSFLFFFVFLRGEFKSLFGRSKKSFALFDFVGVVAEFAQNCGESWFAFGVG